jgi:hypothetical protein
MTGAGGWSTFLAFVVVGLVALGLGFRFALRLCLRFPLRLRFTLRLWLALRLGLGLWLRLGCRFGGLTRITTRLRCRGSGFGRCGLGRRTGAFTLGRFDGLR